MKDSGRGRRPQIALGAALLAGREPMHRVARLLEIVTGVTGRRNHYGLSATLVVLSRPCPVQREVSHAVTLVAQREGVDGAVRGVLVRRVHLHSLPAVMHMPNLAGAADLERPQRIHLRAVFQAGGPLDKSDSLAEQDFGLVTG